MSGQPPPDPGQAFVATLGPSHRRVLEQLRTLLKSPRGDLRWHHAVGRLLVALLHGDFGRVRGQVNGLAAAATLSPSQVYQHVLFAERYSEPQAEELQSAGLGWGMMVALMGVRDDTGRLRLQQDAITQGWTLSRLRLEIRRSRRTRRRGGGRRRRRVEHFAGEAALQQLEDLTASWLILHDERWADGDLLHGLQKALAERDGSLRTRLAGLATALGLLTRHADVVRGRLDGLLGNQRR